MIKKVEELDTKILTEFTNSERVYVGIENGSVKVPMREIKLSSTKNLMERLRKTNQSEFTTHQDHGGIRIFREIMLRAYLG